MYVCGNESVLPVLGIQDCSQTKLIAPQTDSITQPNMLFVHS